MQNSNYFGTREDKYKKNKKHRKLKVFILILVLLIGGGGAYAMRISGQLKTTVNKIYKPAGNKTVSTAIKNKKTFSVLLLGVDTGAEGRIDKGNSDTMIVATINPKTNKTTLVSIPRDTLAQLQGANSFNMQKINAAYNVGGSKMAMSTVEKLFDTRIDYYITVNMGALSKIVDTIGGVDVSVPFSFSSGGSTFKKGKMHLNGTQALAYARMRYEDPNGDYGRQKRQQQVITSMIKSAVSLKALTNFENILSSLENSIATNLSFDDMVSIQSNYKDAAKHITSDHLQGRSATVEGASYEIPTNDEIQRVSDVLRTALGLKTTTIDNAETKQNDLNTNFTGLEYQQDFTVYSESVMNGGTSTDTTTNDTSTDTTYSDQSSTTGNTWSTQESTSQWNNGY
ncbi:LCP family glycopolymer transferase [Latilactobacillus fuchuensis]|uniref:Cell envelope-related function transcriptional attenuator common domain protein n=1 Tax=Latilactobacillus fuchuensis TaxID=164393 RepID=A0A2N9DYG9_9LACO|nr:LCP family protein [Latilactobacillus fuchuensis]SPC40169.1 Cell envelope-related function transcriptional attenuator common domain protein [Latilactobacillus fuchuensis]